MHSISTLTVSRERQKPASSMVKPTCIPNTRNAATSVQTVLIGLTMSLPFERGIRGEGVEAEQIRIHKCSEQNQRLIPTSFPSSSRLP